MKYPYILFVYLGLVSVVLAVPRAPSPSKYESLKRDSPFTEKPIVVRETKAPEPGLEQDWFIASVVKTTYGEEVIIAKKKERASRMRFGGMHGEGPSGYRIVSVKRGESYKDDQVVIAHGGRTSTLSYDASVAKSKASPQAPRPKQTPQVKATASKTGSPPIPGVNPANASGQQTPRKPRVRYVPPAKPAKK